MYTCISSLLSLLPSPPRLPRLWVITAPCAELPVLYRGFPPAVCFMRGQCCPLSSSLCVPSPFPLCPQVHSSYQGFIMSILWYLFPGGGTWHSVGQALVMKPYVTGSWPFKAICCLDHLVRFSFAVGNCSKEIRYFSDLEGNNHLKTIYKRE